MRCAWSNLRMSVLLALSAALVWPLGAPAMAAQKQITVLRQIDADRYDPQKSVAGAAIEILYLLSDTLVALDFDMATIKPGLAKSWEVSPDGLRYTFKLRDDVTFCDGKKFTAEDAVYTFRRILDPQTKAPFRWRAGDVKDVRAEGLYQLVYELNKPYGELLYQLTQSFALMIDRNNVDALGEDFGVKGFNGTGPFCWTKWEPRNEFVMTRHPTYAWGPPIYQNRGPAHIERMTWRVIPQDNSLFASMVSGEADLTPYIPASSISLVQRAPSLRFEEASVNLKAHYVGFKIDRPLLKEVELRRALVQAVNQSEIAKAVFFGIADPQATYVSAKALDFEPDVGVLSFDPAAASRRLDPAGWKLGPDGFRYKDGVKLQLLALSFPGRMQQVWEAVQGYWRKVGVDVKVQVYDSTIIWSKLRGQDFDSWMMSFDYFSAGDALGLGFMSNNNRMNWNDETTDGMINAGRAALSDDARHRAFSDAQRRVYDAALWIPLVNEKIFLVSNQRVLGTRPHGIYGRALYKGLDLDLK